MKHSSHQIRGKCTYHFVLEPGIAGERVASAVTFAAAPLGHMRHGRTCLSCRFGRGRAPWRFVLVLGDLKLIDSVEKSLERFCPMATASPNINFYQNRIDISKDHKVDALILE